MKYLAIFCLLIFSLVIDAQEAKPQKTPIHKTTEEKKVEETAKSEPTKADTNVKTEKTETKIKESSNVELDLDREYWSYFYIPDFSEKLKEEKEEERKFNNNIIRVFKSEIEKRDSPYCLEELPNINENTVRIREINANNQWIQEVKKKLKHLKFTEYMYLVKYKRYLSYISFEVDPKEHLQSPYQVELVIKSSN